MRDAPPNGRLEISVVVSTYRRPERLRRLVAALEAQTLSPERFEVLIVDNGSGDGTRELLHELAAATPVRLRVLEIDVNRGPAPARNLGWRSASAPYVAFTDDDCVPRPTWLAQLVATVGASPQLGVLQGATLRPRGPHPQSLGTVFRETLVPSPYFEGCNLVFPRAVLDRTGGFDESFTFGGEDTAAGWSAIEDGGEWVFDETAVVEHDVEERPLRWHLMMAWREGNLVDVASHHPSMRVQTFWRPWAHRPWNVAYAFGLASTVVAGTSRQPLLLLGWLPWVRLRRVPVWPPRFALAVLGRYLLNDAVVCAGMARASVRNRTVIL
ncbi:MAG: glycosyltransferase [Acidimicrobiales bacterium]|nr:glycosyltransferase [Acidimicrobiales bacterium]